MNIHQETHDRAIVLTLEGRMDYPIHRLFRDASEKALKTPEADTIIIDLALVTFLDSAALGMLLLLREMAEIRSRKVILRHPATKTLKVLKMVHFHKYLEIQE